MKKLIVISLALVSLTTFAHHHRQGWVAPAVVSVINTAIQATRPVVVAPTVVSTPVVTAPVVYPATTVVTPTYSTTVVNSGYSPPPIPYHISAQWGNTGWGTPIYGPGYYRPTYHGGYHGGYRPHGGFHHGHHRGFGGRHR